MTIAAVGTALMTFGATEALQAASLTVLAGGLDSPRGLTFGPDNTLYVTEAGKGGTETFTQIRGQEFFYGATGSVTRIQNGIAEKVATGLPSYALADGSEATGVHDIAFDATGNAFVTLGWGGGSPSQRDLLNTPDFGNLIAIDRLDGGASWTQVADLVDFEGINNSDGGEIDSNPFHFLIQENTAFIADPAANALLQVGLDTGEIEVKSIFETRLVPNPFGGRDIPMQSVPTSVAVGADGAFYVGELTGFPFPQDAARIYRIDSNEPEIYADGFTNIIDSAVDPDGNLYVLEYATNSILSGDPAGALSRVAPDGTRTTIASEGLISPTAIALGIDGAIYVSNNGNARGAGQVLRIEQTTPIPEPSSVLGMLAFGALSAGSVLKKKGSASDYCGIGRNITPSPRSRC